MILNIVKFPKQEGPVGSIGRSQKVQDYFRSAPYAPRLLFAQMLGRLKPYQATKALSREKQVVRDANIVQREMHVTVLSRKNRLGVSTKETPLL